LLTLLCELTQENVDITIKDMRSLIGYFDLDPNRVFDLVLESFEMRPTVGCHIQLIDLFRQTNLAHILGFKFQFYHASGAEGYNEHVTPASLYRVAALLIASEKLTLDELQPHLWPPLSVLRLIWCLKCTSCRPLKSWFCYSESHKAKEETVLAEAKAYGVVNLASSANEATEEAQKLEKQVTK
jgi:hypothetical protein